MRNQQDVQSLLQPLHASLTRVVMGAWDDWRKVAPQIGRRFARTPANVIYERMIEDTEGEVRRLLDYCGLPFEEGCLRFFENARPVRTASSEQVRKPIYREGVDHWRHYEPWLGPLKDALGEVLETYPEVPGMLLVGEVRN